MILFYTFVPVLHQIGIRFPTLPVSLSGEEPRYPGRKVCLPLQIFGLKPTTIQMNCKPHHVWGFFMAALFFYCTFFASAWLPVNASFLISFRMLFSVSRKHKSNNHCNNFVVL